MKPAVDALIVNYNAGDWLARCATSLVAQVRRIIVVDNASTDGSLSGLPASAEVIRNGANRGFAAALAQAAESSDAPAVLLANPDLHVAPGAVAAMVDVLDGQPSAGIVGARVLDPDGSDQRAGRRRTPTPARAAVAMLGLDRLGGEGVEIREPVPGAPVTVDAVSGALVLVRRTCWDALEGYDPGYFLHCEDLDFFRRAADAGWSTWYQPAARAEHVKGVSQRGRSRLSERHKRDGMIRYFRRFDAATMGSLPAAAWVLLIRLHYLLRLPLLAWRDRRSR
ncbi:MAG: glycosyltransferase family 2 protein [Pseudomonadota bacterium]